MVPGETIDNLGMEAAYLELSLEFSEGQHALMVTCPSQAGHSAMEVRRQQTYAREFVQTWQIGIKMAPSGRLLSQVSFTRISLNNVMHVCTIQTSVVCTGLHWYHPHAHGSNAYQAPTANGLFLVPDINPYTLWVSTCNGHTIHLA